MPLPCIFLQVRDSFRLLHHFPKLMKIFRLFLCMVPLLAATQLQAATGSAVTGDVVIDTRDWTLTVTTPVNGSVSGSGSYLSGTSATLTASPSAGYLFGSYRIATAPEGVASRKRTDGGRDGQRRPSPSLPARHEPRNVPPTPDGSAFSRAPHTG